jgi:hypothetical protein
MKNLKHSVYVLRVPDPIEWAFLWKLAPKKYLDSMLCENAQPTTN